MKKIKKLTFSEMSKKQLDEKQLKTIKGGDYCTDKCGTSSSVIGSVYPGWQSLFFSHLKKESFCSN